MKIKLLRAPLPQNKNWVIKLKKTRHEILAGMLGKKIPHLLLIKCKWVQSLKKSEWWFLKMLEANIPCDPSIPYISKVLDVHHEDTHSSIFIAALFRQVRKQPR